MSFVDELAQALHQYEREGRAKKGVLLTPDGGYYLYNDRCCSICEYDLMLSAESLHIQGGAVPEGLFFGIAEEKLRWAAKTGGRFFLDRLSLIFHIALDEGDLLRGILFAQGENAHLSLFTDPGIELLYRAAIAPTKREAALMQAGDDLSAFAKTCNQNDLHILTALYLHSKKIHFQGGGGHDKRRS